MAFQLKTVDREKLYKAIVEQILDGISSGAYPPGSALPAERVLAEQLGVSRTSLREAIRVLEHAGVLGVRTGSGTYVSQDARSKAATLRAHSVLAGEQSPLDVLAARRALEPACAALAAKYRHDRDIASVRRAFEEHANRDAAHEDSFDSDLGFHIAVAAATHNPVLLMLFERVAELMRQDSWQDFRARQLGHAGRSREYVSQHEAILEALERGDPMSAQREMDIHLDAVEVGLLAEVPA